MYSSFPGREGAKCSLHKGNNIFEDPEEGGSFPFSTHIGSIMGQGGKNWNNPLLLNPCGTVWSFRHFWGMWFRSRCTPLVQVQLLPALSDGDLLGLPGATPHGNRVRSLRGGLATPFLEGCLISYAGSLTVEPSVKAGSIHTSSKAHWQSPSIQPWSLIVCPAP